MSAQSEWPIRRPRQSLASTVRPSKYVVSGRRYDWLCDTRPTYMGLTVAANGSRLSSQVIILR